MNKTNLTILIFFTLHTFFVTCIDCLDLWPTWLVESSPYYTPWFTLGRTLRQFYLDTYQDKFLTEPPGWFVAYDPLLPLGVIPWAVQTFVTTLLCVLELWSWEDRTVEVKWGLTGCYGPYLLISAWLFVVMSARVKDALVLQRRVGKVKGE
ncbi:hypothetical protein UA08_07487 [Talaromyces atroroseus]|uniref:EXPERA domain-containing protein n=1 Tax=Talaromyces atroroseus TaxID=1441469 RepID=A0A225ARR0_TALAT|nr:hypothetical protein UA08_07487 [Talaromyces atroroseus]OKL57135.1 hypothetical protein UA08_07487 [Talaromyces atroroseus]